MGLPVVGIRRNLRENAARWNQIIISILTSKKDWNVLRGVIYRKGFLGSSWRTHGDVIVGVGCIVIGSDCVGFVHAIGVGHRWGG